MRIFNKHGPGGFSEGRHRWSYRDHSQRFVSWVNSLGFEKTWLGRVAYEIENRFRIRRVALIFLACLGLAFLMVWDFDFAYTGYRVGDIASTDIKTPVTFEMNDELSTNSKKLEAEDGIPPVFDLDLNHQERILNGIYKAFREMRRLVTVLKWPARPSAREEMVKDFLRYQGQFEETLGRGDIPARTFEWLTENKFSARIENLLIHVLEKKLSERIVSDLAPVKVSGNPKVIIRIVEGGGGGEEFLTPVNNLADLYGARRSLNLEGLRGAKDLTRLDEENLLRLAQHLLTPNLSLNMQETTIRKQKARDGVLPVMISVKKGQTILAEGSVLQPIHIRILEEIRNRKNQRNTDFTALMIAALMLTSILVFFSFLKRFSDNKIRITNKDLWAMGLVTAITIGMGRVVMFIASAALDDRLGLNLPQTFFIYLLPMAAGSMLIGLVLTSGEAVFMFTLFLSLIMAFIVDQSFPVLVVSFLGGLAAARGVHNCRKRNGIYWAGVRTGLINAIVIGFMTLATQGVGAESVRAVGWNVGAGFISGIASALIAMMLVPLLESLFNYTTNVRLLELGNLDHPLLKAMVVKAPGTYQHSLVVGNMVEAAAEEIGANPLLAKVASYYHDIGKIDHSGYFIENQRQGHNPHDHISATMSRTVLVAHVKDGVELAAKYKLGKPITDIILQHHGTTVISYFYNKARERLEEGDAELSEEEFRYPGPKPQFPEAALCMLADSIEAAARSLDEPTPHRLENIVKNIINRKFMDGQLDECNLTLRDISTIERAFYKILLSIYHQRIDYPRSAGGGASEAPVTYLPTVGKRPPS